MEMDLLECGDGEDISYVVILVTAGNHEEAMKIARSLVEEERVACVNVIDGVASVFRWKGKLEEQSESLLIIKTRTVRLQDVIQRVKALHSYDVPEIIALPIVEGNPSFLKWIDEVT